jgi:hypothetical protein
MPRKPKATVDIMGNLEVMSRDMSLPEAVRAEAAREFVRLKAKEQPAPTPAPAPVPAPMVPDFSELVEAFKKIKPDEVPVTEPKPVEPVPVKPVEPEPVERERGSTWNVGGRQCVYLAYDPVMKLHLLSETRNVSSVGLPEVIKISEERLVGKRYAAGPRARGFESVEDCKKRRAMEQARESYRWRQQMGVGMFGGDPPGT